MFLEEIEQITFSAQEKIRKLEKNKFRYYVLSGLGGIYVCFGALLSLNISGLLMESLYGRILANASFGIALCLIVMAGGELFTGNHLVMSIATLHKQVSLRKTFKLWLYCFLGNGIGVLLFSLLLSAGDFIQGNVSIVLQQFVSAKLKLNLFSVFIRAFLCNMLICAAIWITYRSKNEVAKLLIIFLCVFTFTTCALEHSVADMAYLSFAFFSSMEGFRPLLSLYFLAVVSLGNLLGGVIGIALPYWYISSED
ncbi:transporter [Clostridia bacterium]|nr:transporter [Clostridia bacterium]